MTEQYGTDTSEDNGEDETIEELKPIEIIDKTPKEKEKNPTSYDTKDEWDFNPSEEELKEMKDAT